MADSTSRLDELLLEAVEEARRSPMAARERQSLVDTLDKLQQLTAGEEELAAEQVWRLRLGEALEAERNIRDVAPMMARYGDAFPEPYQDVVTPNEAVADLLVLNRLGDDSRLGLRLLATAPTSLSLKLYVYGEALALSDVLPQLEFFGLRVISETSWQITPADNSTAWIQRLELEHERGGDCAEAPFASLFEDAFLKVEAGELASDGLNALILGAGLPWRKVRVLRAFCRYLVQTGVSISFHFMVLTLRQNPQLAAKLITLFETRFDPSLKPTPRQKALQDIDATIGELLESVPSLDADRVLRGLARIIKAGVRTNYFQVDANGEQKPWLSVKLRSADINELPSPRPLFETFVYSADTEAIHLRAALVSRGGLRWSDRREDFRTEVLSLMKTQQVKNAIIVPEGAKGGFVVKRHPLGVSRRDQGIYCYRQFISGLLDITDNQQDGKVVPPEKVVRHDADDPYLVVAADKGTAAFSDIANAVSADYGYWLGDAFASGGSHGYDHKAMGITARGGWESVKRHFAEQGLDTQSDPFTVVGIGDMAGDVFGNGMLLSRQIRLVAAFNHLHVFIDPDPDPETSFQERERLFKTKGSSWTDYRQAVLSAGGAIYERSAKYIDLSDEAKHALGVEASRLTPDEVIQAILRAPVDLLWNGGIGTYVKAAGESAAEVGDHANDALRVNGGELRCKVVGEGGNLGFTQRGRIEYARNGGRINTDFVDNAGGVGSSDREVNIKIPLNSLLINGKLTDNARDKLLKSMTRDLAKAVLEDNQDQTLVLSLMERESVPRLGEQAQLIRYLEHRSDLDRSLEALPDEETLDERRTSGQGLTRPEISILLAYSKMKLYRELLASELVDDAYFDALLLDYFPTAIRSVHAMALHRHGLRRSIIATRLTNNFVNHVGIAFPHRPTIDRGEQPADIARAYVVVSEMINAPSWWRSIARASNMELDASYELMEHLMVLIKRLVWWLLERDEERQAHESISQTLERFHDGVDALRHALPKVLHGAYQKAWEKQRDKMRSKGASARLARSTASTAALRHALDIVSLNRHDKNDMMVVASVYFALGDRLHLPWLLDATERLHISGQWQAIARARLREDLTELHAIITSRLLKWNDRRVVSAPKLINAWLDVGSEHINFSVGRLDELYAAGTSDFASLSVAVGELRSLV